VVLFPEENFCIFRDAPLSWWGEMTQRVNIWLSAGTPTVAGTRAELKSENIRNLRLQVFQKRQHIQQIILKPDYMEQSHSNPSQQANKFSAFYKT
jgi:hypothetical protein